MWGILVLLVILPIFTVLTVTSLIYLFKYTKSKNKVFIRKIFNLWVVPVILVISFLILHYFNGPIPLTKERIIGYYNIDTSFYSGKNATWQKEHYRFQITKDDKFILYERLSDGSEKQFINKVNWVASPTYKWSIIINNPHHIIEPMPTLHRTMNNRRFYYVFKSTKFGNMFFRKVKNS
jgi:amino acid transporter